MREVVRAYQAPRDRHILAGHAEVTAADAAVAQ
jgi:hypothetical protein